MTALQRHALRFVIGGSVTLAIDLIAQNHGPVWAGLFLAFPVLLPTARPRIAACTALGATLGSVGLFLFALVACCDLSFGHTASALLPATAAWILGAALAGIFWKRRRRPKR